MQTCGRQNALSSALYSSRVARLQDQVQNRSGHGLLRAVLSAAVRETASVAKSFPCLQVDRLQQRNVEEDEEHRVARQSFQNRLQQLHESWQDCFDRHQHAWSREKALAEVSGMHSFFVQK